MRRIITIFAILLFKSIVFAQSPEKISYQAVVRDVSNNIADNKLIGMRISILQGSLSGIAVYEETHTTTTNDNGLVSIEIGTGSGSTGVFSTIDWANSTYFIKTEIDPTGGTTYTITGTTQLLSVPYALHAKSADKVTGTINETDPVFTAWDKDYEDLINTPAVADGSETKLSSGTNIEVTGSGSSEAPYVVSSTSVFKVGDSYRGGVVVYVDETGMHGLIAKFCSTYYGNSSINANAYGDADGIGSGLTNSILHSQSSTFVSSVLSYTVTVDGIKYGGWYLPSLYELQFAYLHKDLLGVPNNIFISSVKVANQSLCYCINFSNGQVVNQSSTGTGQVVIAMKQF